MVLPLSSLSITHGLFIRPYAPLNSILKDPLETWKVEMESKSELDLASMEDASGVL